MKVDSILTKGACFISRGAIVRGVLLTHRISLRRRIALFLQLPRFVQLFSPAPERAATPILVKRIIFSKIRVKRKFVYESD